MNGETNPEPPEENDVAGPVGSGVSTITKAPVAPYPRW
jgi:hypothetical protein